MNPSSKPCAIFRNKLHFLQRGVTP